MFIITVITFMVTITVIVILYQYFPVLRFGWTKFIFGKNINIVGSATNTGDRLLNIIIGIPFMILFLIAIPRLAYREEILFRQNVVSKKQMILKSFGFGIIHCVMGIPLAMGIGLSIGGFLLAYIYRSNFLRLLAAKNISTTDGKTYNVDCDSFKEKKVLYFIKKANKEALLYSTSYHSMWNILYVIIIIISLFL